jgi:hypothetical protein
MKQPVVVNENMRKVFESAARFQQLVPDAVLVGGTAVSAYAGHRYSVDHDHVLTDLEERFASIFEMLDAHEAWMTAHVVEGKVILGSFDGIETGLRQLRRTRPLETQVFELENGETIRVPSLAEMIRVKAFLITNRNQLRDYLDVAALADRFGVTYVAEVLCGIDAYYDKELSSTGSVAGELVELFSDPNPKDRIAIDELAQYKGLDEKFADWNTIVLLCKEIAAGMIANGGEA